MWCRFVSKNDEICIKNEELCIKNEKLCLKNEEFCIYFVFRMMNFAAAAAAAAGAAWREERLAAVRVFTLKVMISTRNDDFILTK